MAVVREFTDAVRAMYSRRRGRSVAFKIERHVKHCNRAECCGNVAENGLKIRITYFHGDGRNRRPRGPFLHDRPA